MGMRWVTDSMQSDKTVEKPQPFEQEGGPNYGRYVLFVLIIVYIFNFIDRQILSILAEEIKMDLGIGDAEIGFLYGTAFAIFSGGAVRKPHVSLCACKDGC